MAKTARSAIVALSHEALYRQVCRVLEDIDEPYWTAVAKFGKGADKEHEEYVAKVLLK